MFSGETVTLYTPTTTYDENKDEVSTYTPQIVENVLFGKPTTEQVGEAMRLYSVEAQYALGIPKTFTESLRGCYVVRDRDAGMSTPHKYWIAGDPQPIPPENCPTPWNREVIAGWIDG